MEKILIVDDNEYLRYTLTELMADAGYKAFAVENGTKAIEEIKAKNYDLIILDMKLPGMNGIEILTKIKEINQKVPVIMLTAFGDVKNAVNAMKQGAQDYITKPFENEAMLITIKKALEMKYLNEEVSILRKKYESHKPQGVIGNSPVMREIFDQVKVVAPSMLTVLIEGESGTGKEVIANMIHGISDRKDKPWIAVDCGAIPDTLIESELFGHEKGAFTDARTQKEGKFELANGGTIFLDEITNLSEPNQIKLLRVIQERNVTRLGGKKPIGLNVRIITATNVPITESVNSKKFREDLYYRLNEFHMELPPLRKRSEDIPLFVDAFINDANHELGKNVTGVSKDVMEQINLHSWPGNVRELRNVIRRAVLLTNGEIIETINISNQITNSAKPDILPEKELSTFESSTKLVEKEIIMKALTESGGNKSKAAKILNMNERTFYRKLKNLGIQ